MKEKVSASVQLCDELCPEFVRLRNIIHEALPNEDDRVTFIKGTESFLLQPPRSI